MDSSVDAYDYELPAELIAQHPLTRREDARLMLVQRSTGGIFHYHIRDLPELLTTGDLLVLNDSRVIPAKLVGYRERTRGRWQGLFLEVDKQGAWKLLGKTRGRLEIGETIVLQDAEGVERLRLVVLSRLEDASWVMRPQSPGDAYELLKTVGRVPLPHYIREGNMETEDVRNYQTVFASKPGSIAAPTAGLHLTKPLINQLIDSGAAITRVTLHVGVGTFRPIKVKNWNEHVMHSEWGSLDEKAYEQIVQCQTRGNRVIAVGTTSARVLETAARQTPLAPWTGNTNLFIRPGFDFKIIDGLLTNFHLPRSTLLILVRAFGGDELLQNAYRIAIEEKYRFFSYGDAMLIT